MFRVEVRERLGDSVVAKLSDGRFETKDKIYKYVAHKIDLRAHRPNDVEFWGPTPYWFDEESEAYVQMMKAMNR